jgi:hypothetical protein
MGKLKQKVMKNFGISDNSCMFVSISDQGINMIDENGYFYILLTTLINKIRLFKSHVVRFIICVTVPWSELRGEQSFLFNTNSNFVTTMTKEDKNLKGRGNNTITSRNPTKRGLTKAQLTEQLNQYTHRYRIERNAKNQAYAYIISEGKLCGFADFCRKYPEADWHAACLTGLLMGISDT